MLTANAKIEIQKNIEEVFEAIVDPIKMSGYFIATSSGVLEENSTVQWTFPEFSDSFPVTGKRIKQPYYISFDWSGGQEHQLVEMQLTAGKSNSTIIQITEREMPINEEGIEQMKKQTEGWANFLACLKAYLEYGINLRQGAFDFLQNNE